jgi:hypothetical protein
MMNQEQKKYLNNILQIKRKELERYEHLFEDRNQELSNQIERIRDKWEEVVKKHHNTLRLIILAEAPLSFEKYFYNNTGTFLNGLKIYYALNKNSALPEKMLEEGILLLDIYELPIPTEYYKRDKKNSLFNKDFFEERIRKINELVGVETRFVFRYKQLFEKKKLHNHPAFKHIKDKILINSTGEPVSLFNNENSQDINDIVKSILKHH